MPDGDFFDFGFDSTFDFNPEDYLGAGNYQAPDIQAPKDWNFDFKPNAFEEQGTGWTLPDWMSSQPTYSLGGAGTGIQQPNAYNALFNNPGVTHFDPSTGTYFDSTGNPVQPQSASAAGGPMTAGSQVTAAQDPEAFLRQGGPSPYDSSSGYGGAAAAAAAARNPQAGPPGGSGSAGGGWLDTINGFLKSPLGGLLGAAGIGAAGLGIGRAVAGPVPNAPNPQVAPGNPVNAQGQASVANMLANQADVQQQRQAAQAPQYTGIQNQALTLIPGQLNPQTLETINDPIQQALQKEIQDTMAPGATNPVVEAQIQKDWATLQNQMYKALGPDWQLSTPGQEALNSFNRNANMTRYQARQSTITGLSPLEQNRRQFAYTAPVNKLQAIGGEQRANYGTLANATSLGNMDVGALQAGLGGNPDTYRALQTSLTAQGQMAGYNAKTQDRSQLMSGIGGVTGTVAGQVAGLGSSDRIAKAVRDAYGNPTGVTA